MGYPFRTLDDIKLAGKKVLIRVDINVPLEQGSPTDITRIQKIVPTVLDVMEKGGYPILLAHLGRPDGKVNRSLSLRALQPTLSEALDRPVRFVETCAGELAEVAVKNLDEGEVLLLENTRFEPGEEQNDPALADMMAKLGDVFVNDAFSVSHRAHVTTVGLAERLPSCAGRQMQAELSALEKCLTTPEHPVIAVVGGAKVSTKLELIGNLLHKVDQIIIGGGMANTFLAAKGYNVGNSLCEHDFKGIATDIMNSAQNANCEIVLPVDIVVADTFEAHSPHSIVACDACPDEKMILDIGVKSIQDIEHRFETAKTLVWNGPLGAFEIKPFDTATRFAAKKAADLTKAGRLLSVAGGGDTVAALNTANAAKDFSYISTAGGAFLEWLEGKTLPGVLALQTHETINGER